MVTRALDDPTTQQLTLYLSHTRLRLTDLQTNKKQFHHQYQWRQITSISSQPSFRLHLITPRMESSGRPALTPTPGPSPFLRLPPQVRRAIYFWAGLAPLQWDGLQFVLDLHGDFDTSRLGFHDLLLSCTTIYNEASALLYSLTSFIIRMPPSNQYALYLPQRTGLAPLRALTKSSLASLRHLKIVLSEASCHPRKHNIPKGSCCDYVDPRLDIPPYACKRHEGITHDGPLIATDPFTRIILDEWQSTVSLLSSQGVVFSNLELCLVCDVRDDEPQIVQIAVTPLALLTPPKDCHIRLCRDRSVEIQEIAGKAVLRARGISQLHQHPAGLDPPGMSGGGSRLLALPRELHLRILEYTDLIAPYKEVTWDRSLAAYSVRLAGCYNLEVRGMTCQPRAHHGCQFSRCWLTYPKPSIG